MGLSTIQIFTLGLVFLGAVIIFRSLSLMQKIQAISRELDVKKNWNLLNSFILFFLISYLVVLYIVIKGDLITIQWLIGIIFSAGSVFVFVTLGTTLKTLNELKESETRFQHMIEGIENYAILMLDKKGNILSWNSGAEKIKGYKSDEIIGKNFKVFYTEEDCNNGKPERLIKTAIKEGKANDEGLRLRKDGSTFWGNVTITAMYDENKQIIGFSKITRDLTARKIAENAREQYTQQIEVKNKELEQFIYIASHDLQEPLVTLTGLIDMLSNNYDKQFDERGQRIIGYITQTKDQMSQLIKGLLDYGRLGQNKELVTVDCQRIMEDLKQDLAPAIQNSNATIEVGELPRLQGYEMELRLLFRNLISNAIKFRKPDTNLHICISAEQQNGNWKFAVQDNGIGIQEKYKDRIFVIYQRIHKRSEYKGIGIGLAHCRKIVELHGGKIWVESQPNEGSTFYFTLKN